MRTSWPSLFRDGPSDARRSIVVEQMRKVTIGDAEITIDLADGARLHRSLERVRHGNDARLIVRELAVPDAHRARAFALARPSLSQLLLG